MQCSGPGACGAVRLLLVEDDPMIGAAAQRGLQRAGHAVDLAANARDAELAIANGVYDAVVLDLGLPDRSGKEVLRGLRERGNEVPVLIATARDAVADRIAGLDAGADDYIVKPFELDELIARLRAVLRRHVGRGSPLVEHGPLTLDPATRTLRLNARPVDLSAREFAVLEALMRRPGTVVSRAALEEAVYGWDEEVGSNAIEVHLHNLRRKLGADLIRNVRGVGWRIAVGED